MLKEVRDKLTGDEKLGVDILRRAMTKPLFTIAQNAGTDGSVVVEDVLAMEDDETGFDASTGKFVNMLDAGIVDPTKVTVTALRNAVSISGLMMTTETLVTELDEEEEPVDGAVG